MYFILDSQINQYSNVIINVSKCISEMSYTQKFPDFVQSIIWLLSFERLDVINNKTKIYWSSPLIPTTPFYIEVGWGRIAAVVNPLAVSEEMATVRCITNSIKKSSPVPVLRKRSFDSWNVRNMKNTPCHIKNVEVVRTFLEIFPFVWDYGSVMLTYCLR